MALRLTGQPGPIRAVHCWLNVVSPGNAGRLDRDDRRDVPQGHGRTIAESGYAAMSGRSHVRATARELAGPRHRHARPGRRHHQHHHRRRHLPPAGARRGVARRGRAARLSGLRRGHGPHRALHRGCGQPRVADRRALRLRRHRIRALRRIPLRRPALDHRNFRHRRGVDRVRVGPRAAGAVIGRARDAGAGPGGGHSPSGRW